jgi:hypothetical protein
MPDSIRHSNTVLTVFFSYKDEKTCVSSTVFMIIVLPLYELAVN